jgi:hypothetical protein
LVTARNTKIKKKKQLGLKEVLKALKYASTQLFLLRSRPLPFLKKLTIQKVLFLAFPTFFLLEFFRKAFCLVLFLEQYIQSLLADTQQIYSIKAPSLYLNR